MNNPIFSVLQQLKANPLQFLMQRKLNIPQNIPVNDPNAIMNYLLQSGQITQQQINNAYIMAQRFR